MRMGLVFNWTVQTSFAFNMKNQKNQNAMLSIVMVTSASTGRVIHTISVQNLSAQIIPDIKLLNQTQK